MRQDSGRGLCRKTPAPAIGVKVPTDFDPSVAIGQRFEQNGSGWNVTTALDDSPRAKPGIRRERCAVALKALHCLLAIRHRNAGEPARDLVAPVDVKEAIGLIRPPWADEEPIRRGQTVVISSHARILTFRASLLGLPSGPAFKVGTVSCAFVTSRSCSVTGPRSSVRDVVFPSAPSPTVMRSRTRSQGRK